MMRACGRLLIQLRAYAKGIALDIYACYLQKIATSLRQRVSPYHLALKKNTNAMTDISDLIDEALA